MNIKTMATVLVAILIASAFVGALASENASDAVEGKELQIRVDDTTVGANAMLYFVESGYVVPGEHGYSLEWKAFVASDNSYAVNGEGQSIGSRALTSSTGSSVIYGAFTSSAKTVQQSGGNPISVTLTESNKGNPNEYNLNVKAVDGTTSSVTPVYLVLQCIVTIVPESGNTITLKPFSFNFEVTVGDAATEKTMEITNDNISLTQFNTIDQNLNVNIDGAVLSGTSAKDDYTWYAIGLPKGLSMSVGRIIGYTYAVDNGHTSNVTIIAMNKTTGDVYTDTITVNVNPAGQSESLTVEAVFDDNAGSGGEDTVVTNGGTYYAEENTAGLKFTLNFKTGTTPVTNVTAHVTAVNSDGVAEPITVADGAYTVNASGSGSYIVSVTAIHGAQQATMSFVIHIINAGEGDATAAIGISSE
ncbi:MAG: hypothetical protein A3205_09005 [Methanomassiliicoccales archaeon Mx-03]|nr:MAG: hypothetical protein A3205_09005 [Methanomassiliicoccales archaeon Mx-03]